jgi:hypothetical protein
MAIDKSGICEMKFRGGLLCILIGCLLQWLTTTSLHFLKNIPFNAIMTFCHYFNLDSIGLITVGILAVGFFEDSRSALSYASNSNGERFSIPFIKCKSQPDGATSFFLF